MSLDISSSPTFDERSAAACRSSGDRQPPLRRITYVFIIASSQEPWITDSKPGTAVQSTAAVFGSARSYRAGKDPLGGERNGSDRHRGGERPAAARNAPPRGEPLRRRTQGRPGQLAAGAQAPAAADQRTVTTQPSDVRTIGGWMCVSAPNRCGDT